MDKKPYIVVVDDTLYNLEVLSIILKDIDADVWCAESGVEALKMIKTRKPDLILLDIMMPDMDGYEVCSILKSHERTKDIPVIYTTARIDENSIEKAYGVGGIDYIKKPFKPMELLARIKTHIKIKVLIDDLEYMSSYDQMTGAYNRKKFFELAINKFEESKKDLYALMVNIDKFKIINETFGHSVGDAIIKTVANTIDKYIIENSIYGRVGGAEFSIICRANSKTEVLKSIELIRKEINKLKLIADDGTEISISISEGIAKANENTKSIDELLKEVYGALYLAQDTTRDNVMFRGRE